VLKWPDTEHPDFKQFFPNSILETGHDILFFWVARMVMMSLWLTDKLPFKTVYLHPIVCDKDGEKMSKSKGNVIDPLEVIEGTPLDKLLQKLKDGNLPKNELEKSLKKKELDFPEGIPECGSDALRFGLLSYMIQSGSVNLDILVIKGYRQFCNKIWNTFIFGYKQFSTVKEYHEGNYSPAKCSFLNSWILGKLDKAINGVNSTYGKYEFGQATKIFHNFWLYELCDIYIEATKPVFSGTNEDLKKETSHTLFQCIETGLRLLHPMMPFITEELYQKLPQYKDKRESISVHSYPIGLEQLFKNPSLPELFARNDKDFQSITDVIL
jgi:valyl-tRNA synthetase